MINLKQELQGYRRIDLKSLAEDGIEVPDDIKNSLVLYNKAVDNLTANSEDIAIIELKRAVSLNPNFYEAMNLLGLCYLHINESDKASELFKKVAVSESNGAKALKYLEKLESGEARGQGSQKRIKSSDGKKDGKSDRGLLNKNPAGRSGRIDAYKYIVGFIAGSSIMLLLTLMFFNVGGREQTAINEAHKPKTTAAPVVDKSGEEEYNKLNEDYLNLKKELDAAGAKQVYYKNVSQMLEAEKLFQARDYEGAADKLVPLALAQFEGIEGEKYRSLCEAVLPKAAEKAFNQGIQLYNSKKYEDALKALSKVETYYSKWPQMDSVLYHMGMSYKALDNSRDALAVFQKLKSHYPESWMAERADRKIKELSGPP